MHRCRDRGTHSCVRNPARLPWNGCAGRCWWRWAGRGGDLRGSVAVCGCALGSAFAGRTIRRGAYAQRDYSRSSGAFAAARFSALATTLFAVGTDYPPAPAFSWPRKFSISKNTGRTEFCCGRSRRWRDGFCCAIGRRLTIRRSAGACMACGRMAGSHGALWGVGSDRGRRTGAARGQLFHEWIDERESPVREQALVWIGAIAILPFTADVGERSATLRFVSREASLPCPLG